jgi:opacity protein-like surface antigen
MALSTRTTLLKLSAMATLSASALFAEMATAEGGVYVVASYGSALSTYSRREIDDATNAQFDGRAAIDSSHARKNKPIWSAGVGYLFSPGFGIEASYLSLGTLEYRGDGTGPNPANIASIAVDFETKSRGPALALVWDLPMSNRWGVNARLGAYRVKSSTDYTVTIDEDIDTGTQSATSTSLLAGVGASFTTSPHLVLRLDYLYLDKVKEKLVEEDFDANLITAGFAYVF